MLTLKPLTADRGWRTVHPKRVPATQVSFASWAGHPPARMHVELLGPCFKTGRMEELHQRPEHAGTRTGPPKEARAHGPRLPWRPPAGISIAPRRNASHGSPRWQAPHVQQGGRRRSRRPALPRRGCTTSLHPLLARQFQALFNSLFKVLFILPSRYFFAIGPSHVFSLGWDLPPDWGCIPKQPDSSTTPRCAAGSGSRRGCHPLRRPLPGNLHTARCRGCLSRLQFRGHQSPRIFSLGYSRFARRYQGNPRWFLFLRLVICLN
jgi:hypothetical protein